jgi:hypothetical protein
MNVLSFSLYGNNPIYTIGAIKNAQLRESLYPDWEMRVYYNNYVPEDIIKQLHKLGVNLINTQIDQSFMNSLWRFLPAADPTIAYFISRDLDSRISKRDVAATQEWIESGKDFHIIRDHPGGHGWPINAGMWGCRGGAIPNLVELMRSYLSANPRYGDKSIDQCFLRDVIHPIAVKSLFLHDEYYNYERIGVPIKRDRKLDDFQFIGESVDENDAQRGPDPDCQRRSIRNLHRA